MLLAMNQTTTLRWSFEEDVHYYRRAGFRAVGVWKQKLDDFGVERGAEVLADAGLSISSLSWIGGFTGNDLLNRDEVLDEARQTIDAAELLGADCVVMHPGPRNRHTRRHANRLMHAALEELLPHASVAGVPLVIEPMHPACARGWTFLTDLQRSAELVRTYDTRWLRLAYDVYQSPLGADTEAVISEVAPLLGLVQIADHAVPHTIDADRCQLGAGAAPLERVVAALHAAGYDGAIEVEIVGSGIEPSCYESVVYQSATKLKSLLMGARHTPKRGASKGLRTTAGGA